MCLIRKLLQSQHKFPARILLRYLSNNCDPKATVYIASAVRTPIASYAESIANQLPRLITETALKQAAIPREEVAQVFAANPTGDLQLHKKTKCAVVGDSLDAVLKSIEAIQSGADNVNATVAVGVAGYDTAQQSAQEEMLKRFNRAWCDGIYDAEIMPVQTRQPGSRQLILVTCDEATQPVAHLTGSSGGNVSLTLCTQKMADNLNLKPLARIVAYEQQLINEPNILDDTLAIVKQLLNKVELTMNDIKAWELPMKALPCIETLRLNRDNVNSYGCVAALRTVNGAPTALFSLAHMAHVLPAAAFGCVLSYEGARITAFLIQNISQQQTTDHQLPIITLYTKNPCPLCDVVLDELEANFNGQYKLEKIDITLKNNVRFLRLYRHDIPVLFLNGQFLCMHKLSVKLLQRKLEQFKC